MFFVLCYKLIAYVCVPGASMGVPTHDEVMRESSDGQGESELEGLLSRTCLSVYPKTRICLFYYFMTFTNSSDINGGGVGVGAIPDHFSLKEINLEF